MEEKLREKEEIYDDKCQKTDHLLLGIDYKWHSDAFWNTGSVPFHGCIQKCLYQATFLEFAQFTVY